jgi:superfamily I DNA/RNA helicase
LNHCIENSLEARSKLTRLAKLILRAKNYENPLMYLESSNNKCIISLYSSMQAKFLQLGLIQFGDMIHQALSLIRSDSCVLESIKTEFSYYFCDEFQDTNR